MMEHRIRILQRTSFSRHAKVLQGKLSPYTVSESTRWQGGCLVGYMAGLLVAWLGGLVVLTSLPSAISLLVSRFLSLSFFLFSSPLSLFVFALLYFFSSSFFQFCSVFLTCLLSYSRLAEDRCDSRAKKMTM